MIFESSALDATVQPVQGIRSRRIVSIYQQGNILGQHRSVPYRCRRQRYAGSIQYSAFGGISQTPVGHRRIEMNLVQIVQEKDLRVSFSSNAGFVPLSRLSDFDYNQVTAMV